ncbi:hypothetical protein FH972_025674 [Carpinus fangiana]|uniref:DUF676 domain-containing protein n=1 Tax=Carpinus fangiana TaxID=176857 RepID=A0A5N6L4A5_9ROSI|nr:hypothetical protein FH972_025674 [Carpinus fangiana]
MSSTPSERQDLHLCVFVHGLWGSPGHLSFISGSLRDAHPDLHLFSPKTNAGNLTYDGIEVGGERVTEEVEKELSELEAAGKKVTRMSVIGYSLGGLIARYVVGLLYSRGVFERGIEPVNFTTFATPHLGVRSPVIGWKNQLFNVFGARTLSASGTQLFATDTFRDTGRPLLAVLADPGSIFVRGLALFQKRSLYANIINDRSVTFYTAGLSRHDPFVNLDLVNLHPLDGFEGVILDPASPASPKTDDFTALDSISSTARAAVNAAPYALAMTVFLPIGITAYLVNSGWQSYASVQRVREHETKATAFRQFPLLLEDARRRAEHAVESLSAAAREEDYLPESVESASSLVSSVDTTSEAAARNDGEGKEAMVREKTEPAHVAPASDAPWPTLALTSEQFAMIDTLQPMFERYPVHISKATHSHAAIIRRLNRESFSEGFIVARHWVEGFIA